MLLDEASFLQGVDLVLFLALHCSCLPYLHGPELFAHHSMMI